jgi:hypothetical protein
LKEEERSNSIKKKERRPRIATSTNEKHTKVLGKENSGSGARTRQFFHGLLDTASQLEQIDFLSFPPLAASPSNTDTRVTARGTSKRSVRRGRGKLRVLSARRIHRSNRRERYRISVHVRGREAERERESRREWEYQLLGRAVLFVFNSYLIYFLRLRASATLAVLANEMEGAVLVIFLHWGTRGKIRP